MVKTAANDQRLREVESKLKRSCRQVRVLDRRMDVLKVRYNRAQGSHNRAAFSSFRLQLATLEGVRQAFYIYACERAAEKNLLKTEMVQGMRDGEE
jgi:hypothetical protein